MEAELCGNAVLAAIVESLVVIRRRSRAAIEVIHANYDLLGARRWNPRPKRSDQCLDVCSLSRFQFCLLLSSMNPRLDDRLPQR
jgi:hypothetical protein